MAIKERMSDCKFAHTHTYIYTNIVRYLYKLQIIAQKMCK